METIRTTIDKVIESWQSKQQRGTEDIVRQGLKQFLAKQEHRHIKYCSLRESRITLGVDSSAWLYLVNLKKRQLLKHLNQILDPKDALTEIFLQLDTKKSNKKR